jgi:hypothetical protein
MTMHEVLIVPRGAGQAKATDAFSSVEDYIAAVERYRALVGSSGSGDLTVSPEAAEAELERRSVWRGRGEVSGRGGMGGFL